MMAEPEKKGGKIVSYPEMIKSLAEENQTRKILEILRDCKDLEEAKEKISSLLKE